MCQLFNLLIWSSNSWFNRTGFQLLDCFTRFSSGLATSTWAIIFFKYTRKVWCTRLLVSIWITFQENKDMLTKYRGWFLCIAKSERWGAASTWENLVELKLFVHRVLSSHIAYVSKLQVWWNLWHSAANLHGCNVSSLSLVWKQVIWRELLLLNWSDEVLSNFGFYPLFLIKHTALLDCVILV